VGTVSTPGVQDSWFRAPAPPAGSPGRTIYGRCSPILRPGPQDGTTAVPARTWGWARRGTIAAMSIFIALALVFALLLGGLGLLAAMLLWKRRSAEAGGCCGKCGYSTRALTTFACPECGADLREVGIVQPTKRAVPTVAILVTAGVLGVFVLLCCGGIGLPMWVRFRSAPMPATTATVAPVSTPPPRRRRSPAKLHRSGGRRPGGVGGGVRCRTCGNVPLRGAGRARNGNGAGRHRWI
jgi:hypothetical protein